jgi:hypothetical protein
VAPEALIWDFEENVSGGQSDRRARRQTFAPYGRLINDPNCRRPAVDTVRQDRQGTSKSRVDDHFLAIPKYTMNKEPSLRFTEMALYELHRVKSFFALWPQTPT